MRNGLTTVVFAQRKVKWAFRWNLRRCLVCKVVRGVKHPYAAIGPFLLEW